MIKLSYGTPVIKLEKIKVGDEIEDEYQSMGKVVKINKNVSDEMFEYTFHLDNKQTIYIIRKAI